MLALNCCHHYERDPRLPGQRPKQSRQRFSCCFRDTEILVKAHGNGVFAMGGAFVDRLLLTVNDDNCHNCRDRTDQIIQ